MRILENANFNFTGTRRRGYIFSGVLLTICLLSLLFRGIETGIDFQGGTEIVVETAQPLGATNVRSTLTSVLGTQPEVKLFGAPEALLIRTTAAANVDAVQQSIVGAIQANYPGSNPQVIKVDSVGPRFADDLRRGAIYAVLASLLVIFLYIMLRFEWRFSLGAVAALAHDVIVVLGLFSLLSGILPFSLQIDQAIIAAFLTIVGYSLNDTVVIFDRIREYTNLFKTEPYERVVNRSINTTLSRTLVTSGTTLITVLVLFLFGGEVLRGFAFALLMGIIVGTYSTIYIATPVLLELRKRNQVAVAK
jgi:preprotein translocase subunit SecF